MPLLNRRQFLKRAGLGASSVTLSSPIRISAAAKNEFRLATFSVEVTPPLGHPLMAGGIAPAREIADPLFARGWVLLSREKPIVVVSVDWCEIRTDAYARWRQELARAARTDPKRVLVTSVHVHDAPVADLQAQRILQAHQAAGKICDPVFHEQTVLKVAKELQKSLRSARRITHIGIGQAKVNQVASNRRFLQANGSPTFARFSATRDPLAKSAPEETIDPWLKTLSFWDGSKAVASMHAYAVHPMSFYGGGKVSADFVGMARARRQKDDPSVFQMYVSGCSGNVTAGKYNEGSPANRPVLADRIYRAMVESESSTRRNPLKTLEFRNGLLRLEPRNTAGFTVAELEKQLADNSQPFRQCLAAMGVSWRKLAGAEYQIDVPLVDFGPAQLLLLPAEAYVEFQLFAQAQRPESFVMVMGYGECAPGYIPIERAWRENDTNLHDWCWVSPGSEMKMNQVIESVLKPPSRRKRQQDKSRG